MTSKSLQERFAFMQEDPRFRARYNIAPSLEVAVIVEEEEGRKLEWMKWGLSTRTAQKRAGNHIANLRAETVTKGSFQSAFRKRRCLVPADGFYEWRTEPDGKWPVRFTLKDGSLFALAGLYQDEDAEGRPTPKTFSLLTTQPNAVVEKVHHRMPVILERCDEARWLSLKEENPVALLKPYPPAEMLSFDVSPALNSTRNDDPRLIQPVKRLRTPDLFESSEGTENQ